MTRAATQVAAGAPAQTGADPEAPLRALHQRLGAVASVLGVELRGPAGDPASDDPASDDRASDERATACSTLLGRVVEHVHAQTTPEGMWLLLTALSGAMPGPEDVTAALRARDTTRPDDLAVWLLEATHGLAGATGRPDLELELVTGAVVVDVDFTARHELHTGIQRVVRETTPRWARDHEVTLVAWTVPGGAMRTLDATERDRVLRWHDRPPASATPSSVGAAPSVRLVVPWRSTVLVPETPQAENCPPLAALSRFSGNRVGMVGHDCIPVVSPELIHPGLPDRFTRYLELVKHAHRLAGVSAGAAQEFRGFTAMLRAQGLTGPTVTECQLPVDVPASEPVPLEDPPLVVSIGSFEPRKNQLAVLHAAELLWREGRRFCLEFIGGGGWATEFDRMMRRLQGAGRPVRRRQAVTDAELWATVRAARFTVFVSLHEGFGLPVAESLSCGTPCLTSAYGSTLQIAEGGGALVVDPRDDEAIAEQMRRLLTDDELVATLRKQAVARPPRTWDDYAREAWEALVTAPEAAEAQR